MIAVIADDFTGAAEIGGIGLKYGLNVIIETKVQEVSEADLLVIATDTRSLSADQASLEIEKITKHFHHLGQKVHTLHDVTFDIHSKEFICVR